MGNFQWGLWIGTWGTRGCYLAYVESLYHSGVVLVLLREVNPVISNLFGVQI